MSIVGLDPGEDKRWGGWGKGEGKSVGGREEW